MRQRRHLLITFALLTGVVVVLYPKVGRILSGPHDGVEISRPVPSIADLEARSGTRLLTGDPAVSTIGEGHQTVASLLPGVDFVASRGMPGATVRGLAEALAV